MFTANQQIPEYLYERRCVTLIPKRPDGSGVIQLGMLGAQMRHFGFDTAEVPEEALVGDGQGGQRIAARTNGINFGGISYRIATRFVDGRRKPQMWSFRLSSEHTKGTLQWVTNFLNSRDVEWLYLCNRHGNQLSTSAFRSLP